MGSAEREVGYLAGGHRVAGDGSDAVSKKVDFIRFLIHLGFHPFMIQTTFSLISFTTKVCSSQLTRYVTYEHNIFHQKPVRPHCRSSAPGEWKPPFSR
jgi:hypothetical protein